MILSIDLETLGTSASAVILSIGAAARTPDGEVATFYSAVNVLSQEGRIIDQSTLDWWMKDPDLYNKTMSECEESPPLPEVLNSLNEWVTRLVATKSRSDTLRPMGNGAAFDIGIMEDAYTKLDRAAPWAFYNVVDLRTIKWLVEAAGLTISTRREGTHHNAVDDAVYQLAVAEEGFAMLTGE